MYEEKELFVTELKPYLFLLDEAHEATGYVVVGDEKELFANLKEAVANIDTDTALTVIDEWKKRRTIQIRHLRMLFE